MWSAQGNIGSGCFVSHIRLQSIDRIDFARYQELWPMQPSPLPHALQLCPPNASLVIWVLIMRCVTAKGLSVLCSLIILNVSYVQTWRCDEMLFVLKSMDTLTRLYPNVLELIIWIPCMLLFELDWGMAPLAVPRLPGWREAWLYGLPL